MYGVGKEQRITTRYTEERGKCIYSKGGAGERMDTCFFVEAVKPMMIPAIREVKVKKPFKAGRLCA